MAWEFLQNMYYGNTVQQWAIAFGIILAAVIIGRILYWISGNVVKKLAAKTKTKADDIIVDMIEEPIVFAVTLIGIWIAIMQLDTSDVASKWIWSAFGALIVINIAWLLVRLFDSAVEHYLVPLTSKSKSDLDDQILPIIRKGTKIIIWTIAIIVALNNAGYNVGALLAGLGIGGLAFALAAKDTLSNIFGGVTIFTDKPFKVKDRIQIEGFDGFVTEIGIRSTRVKTLAGRMVTIPNSTFAENPVENVSAEPSRKVVLNLGLTYDTPPAKMELAMKLLKSIAKKNKDLEEKILLSFNNWNDSSLGIFFAYYIKKDGDIMQTQTDMNMEILTQFNKNKLEFAFPTRTLYNIKG